MTTRSIRRTAAALALGAAALAGGWAALGPAPAVAGRNERVPPVTHPLVAKECGECHMAFQPALLPAGSWARIMDGLADHFGENASLPGETAAVIRAELLRGAGAGDDRVLRITEQRWWLREHRFRPEVWARPDIRSKANCEACHRGAVRGLYEED